MLVYKQKDILKQSFKIVLVYLVEYLNRLATIYLAHP